MAVVNWFPLDRAKFVSAKLSRNRSGFKFQKKRFSFAYALTFASLIKLLQCKCVCVCPLMSFVFVRDRQFEFVGHIYRWRNRTRRASIVSQWFLVLPCHVSTDWSSPKLMRAAQRPSWWFVTSSSAKICSTDSRKVGLIQLIPSDVIGSNHLSVAVLEALWSLAQSRAHRVLQETCHKWIYMSQKAILQATYVHLLMNGEMMKWWTHMNASSLHFPMNTRRSFEAHNLSEAFARPFQLLFFLLKVHESSISLSAKHTKLKSTSKALFEFVRQSWCRLCSGVQEAGLLRVRAVLCPEFTGVVLLDLARDWYMDYIKAC